jgi:hypothetical protein
MTEVQMARKEIAGLIKKDTLKQERRKARRAIKPVPITEDDFKFED